MCVMGEQGVGKLTLAKEIHFQRFGLDAPLMIIDGEKVTDSEIKTIKSKINRLDKGTLLIKKI